MANLHEFVPQNFHRDLRICLLAVKIGNSPKFDQLFEPNIRSVVFSKQVGIHPIPAAFSHDDGPISVLIQTLLEYATTLIISLTKHDLTNSATKLQVGNLCFVCRLGKPGRLENPFHRLIGFA